MAATNEKIVKVSQLLRLLNWKNLLKIIAISLIAILLATLWMFRATIFSSISKTKTVTPVPILYISEPIKSEIITIVTKVDKILAVQIVTINFQKNIRIETFISIDNKTLQEIYTRFTNNKVIETPFFDSDRVNNNRILRLIGGEFVCVPYKDSTAYKYAPDAGMIITDVCAVGIPPIYGEFSGILTIYLKEKPNKDFEEQLQRMARDISIKIYEDNKYRGENKKKP